MARSIGSSFSTQLSSSQLRPFYAIKIQFPTGTLRLATTYADLSINSETYLATANILSISEVTETSDTKAQGVQINLNGLDSSILSAGLTDDSTGSTVDIFFGVLTTSSNADAIVDTPYKVFEGFVDAMVLDENGTSSVLNISVENKLIMLERPTDRRYTKEDQENLFPGDKGLDYVVSLQDKSIAWGSGTT
jgi:hypothetical protein